VVRPVQIQALSQIAARRREISLHPRQPTGRGERAGAHERSLRRWVRQRAVKAGATLGGKDSIRSLVHDGERELERRSCPVRPVEGGAHIFDLTVRSQEQLGSPKIRRPEPGSVLQIAGEVRRVPSP
jgi:hypothetical protein